MTKIKTKKTPKNTFHTQLFSPVYLNVFLYFLCLLYHSFPSFYSIILAITSVFSVLNNTPAAYCQCYIIESVDSISRDERMFH